MASKMPWGDIKAETLRILCKDLGLTSRDYRTRDQMVAFLTKVAEEGIEVAREELSLGANQEEPENVAPAKRGRPKRAREVEPEPVARPSRGKKKAITTSPPKPTSRRRTILDAVEMPPRTSSVKKPAKRASRQSKRFKGASDAAEDEEEDPDGEGEEDPDHVAPPAKATRRGRA
ncbi:hypothetical protein JAAARDRAFT_34716 [Jaapia argillacea MUCL 33604]|uniref:Uncharacterized protein n=1 Tax=Jaapia argillacea MUCL 33604 TaxID=933084 RepID=A0A067PVM7_9AGAM|nr:hypothetical protein JAAARDRAFT_34716 [Jaapia argillacea MUCL 33604]